VSTSVMMVAAGQVVGAGQYNGQFVIFDMRQGSAPADATPIDRSHR
jgi:hypothetical protein